MPVDSRSSFKIASLVIAFILLALLTGYLFRRSQRGRRVFAIGRSE